MRACTLKAKGSCLYTRRQVCSALGADMYDCVYPTRTARFGTALVPEGVLKLKLTSMAEDNRPIDPDCDCMVCQKCVVAFLAHLPGAIE
jgi:queuine tRNA-ribosyltransferase